MLHSNTAVNLYQSSNRDSKRRVLVVDDDTGLQKLVQKSLNRAGVIAYVATTATEVYECLEAARHDLLLLLDYRLSDVTASELVENLIDRGYRIPFIVMTGQGDEKIAVEMMKLGAQDYLVKDQHFLELLPKVVKHNLEQIQTAGQLARAEAVLASQEALYQTLIESVPHVIWLADAADDVVFLNRAWYDITGRSKQNSLGRTWEEAFHPDDRKSLLEKKECAKKRGESFQGEARLRAADGSYRTIEFIGTPVRNRSGKIVNWVGIHTDITERKRAVGKLQRLYEELRDSQAQLMQLEKMNALGTLVAGVAHELNNPMMGILNYLQFCIEKTSKEDTRWQLLVDAESETQRCIDIVRDLLTFSHKESSSQDAYELEDCTKLVERVLRLLNYRIGADAVHLRKRFKKNLPKVPMNVNSMQQVFFNLLNNALDAVRESKRKEIELAIEAESDQFVRVSIADSGCGVADEHIEKIFEPFFTTKPVGKGTGLGLSVCHGIVTSHGGRITFSSKIDEGTRFELRLPLKQISS